MSARWKALAQRIRLECNELDGTVSTIARHWQRAITVVEDQDAFLNSVALNLHSLYSGLERVLQLIALEVDEVTLGGDAWHVELLRQMSLELPQIRPAVVSPETASQLDEYRKFRHRVRNLYAIQLDTTRMKPLVEKLPAIWQQLRLELLAFADFLEHLA